MPREPSEIVNETLRKWANREVLMNKLAFVLGGHREHGGEPWRRRKKEYPWPILHRTGRLQRAVQWTSKNLEGNLINRVPYAKFHQNGTRTMVRRPVIVITQRDIEDLKLSLEKDLTTELNDGG